MEERRKRRHDRMDGVSTPPQDSAGGVHLRGQMPVSDGGAQLWTSKERDGHLFSRSIRARLSPVRERTLTVPGYTDPAVINRIVTRIDTKHRKAAGSPPGTPQMHFELSFDQTQTQPPPGYDGPDL